VKGAAKQTKDEARAAFVAVIRPLVCRLQAAAALSDAEKASLGITVAQAPSPIGAPTTWGARPSAPSSAATACSRSFASWTRPRRPAPPTKAKPAGALGVEIWNKVGTTPPVGPSDLRFVAVDTIAPYVINFNAADGGKANYVWMRWVSPTGERGPRGEQAKATIAA
jgi:hypothetical protein